MNHREKLEELIHHLRLIGESPENVHYIIKEGIWIPSPGYHPSTFPDIILMYHRTKRNRIGYGVPVELKTGHSPASDRPTAISQMRAGADFIQRVLDKPVLRGKYVFIGNSGEFQYEFINRGELV